jgi:hypothetical protein
MRLPRPQSGYPPGIVSPKERRDGGTDVRHKHNCFRSLRLGPCCLIGHTAEDPVALRRRSLVL